MAGLVGLPHVTFKLSATQNFEVGGTRISCSKTPQKSFKSGPRLTNSIYSYSPQSRKTRKFFPHEINSVTKLGGAGSVEPKVKLEKLRLAGCSDVLVVA